jgi:rubrerythrin
MKFNSEESIKVLKYAVEKEKAAEDFYTEKSQTVQTPGAREIFRGLAGDEHKHFEMVSDLLKQAESGAETSTIILPPPSSPREQVEAIFGKLKGGKLPSLSEKSTAKEAFTFALEIEKQSFNHYSQAAEDAENNETAAVYRFLAGEENKHYVMIDNVLDFIDDPGRWLYEEENLIFRL